ncbi:MAG: hypothetical protein GY874_17925 [Desulfobacteraceae bacterium]|nr:hypothetical protein [Desulfobacteraceae bacterium]
MNKNTEKDMLFGMGEIRPALRNVSEPTVLKWYREYEKFPMRKLGGQWVSSRTKLQEWWEKFVTGQISSKKH